MDTGNENYPALNIPASELSAFAVTIDFFIISLKNGELIHFTPDNAENFYNWLVAHGVRDVKQEKIEEPAVDTANESMGGWFKRKRKQHRK